MNPPLHSFRCPVCGHSDDASTAGPETRVTCAHCGTELALGPPDPEGLGVQARVVEPAKARRRSRRKATS